MDKRQADLIFGKIKPQEQTNREEDREQFFNMLADIGAVVVIFGSAMAVMFMPKWLPIVAAWWQS